MWMYQGFNSVCTDPCMLFLCLTQACWLPPSAPGSRDDWLASLEAIWWERGRNGDLGR